MIQTGNWSQDLNAINSGYPQHIRVTFMRDNIVFEDEDFSATTPCQLTTYMNPETDLTFGTAYCSEISLGFIRSDMTDSLSWGQEFTVEFGVENNGTIDWTQVGIFSGKRPLSTSTGIINFTAYDRMKRFDRSAKDFLDLQSYPCSLQEFYEELCSFVSVEPTVGDEIPTVMSRTLPVGFDASNASTCRDLLYMIAEANGCYARVTNDGYIKLVWFENHVGDYCLTRNNIFGLESTDMVGFEGKTWNDLSTLTWAELQGYRWKELYRRSSALFIQRINAVWTDTNQSVLQPSSDYQPNAFTWDDADALTWDEFDEMTWDEIDHAGDEGKTYKIVDNPFIHYSTESNIKSHLQLIIDKVGKLYVSYVAGITAVGNWIVEAGDLISLEMEDGSNVTYPIYSRTMTWNGYCDCDYESTGNIETD